MYVHGFKVLVIACVIVFILYTIYYIYRLFRDDKRCSTHNFNEDDIKSSLVITRKEADDIIKKCEGKYCDSKLLSSNGVNNFNNLDRKGYPESLTLPSFARLNTNSPRVEYIVLKGNQKKEEEINLPTTFDSREKWEGAISSSLDQGKCGSCWAFACCSILTDRIKINEKSDDINNKNNDKLGDDILSPYEYAGCCKCSYVGIPVGNEFEYIRKKQKSDDHVCNDVCEGNYMDISMNFLAREGAMILRNGVNDTYRCIRHQPKYKTEKLFKGTKAHPVSIYPSYYLHAGNIPAEKMNDPDLKVIRKMLEDNIIAIKTEIFTNGPCTSVIDCGLAEGLYNYEKGTIFGTKKQLFKGQTEYHAIVLVGWGEQEGIRYWICRNSWGRNFGDDGYFKVIMGNNLGFIESEVYTIDV